MCLQVCAQNTRSVILLSNYAYSSFILLEILVQLNVDSARKNFTVQKETVWRTVYKMIETNKVNEQSDEWCV